VEDKMVSILIVDENRLSNRAKNLDALAWK
jgi:hypothetical protein